MSFWKGLRDSFSSFAIWAVPVNSEFKLSIHCRLLSGPCFHFEKSIVPCCARAMQSTGSAWNPAATLALDVLIPRCAGAELIKSGVLPLTIINPYRHVAEVPRLNHGGNSQFHFISDSLITHVYNMFPRFWCSRSAVWYFFNLLVYRMHGLHHRKVFYTQWILISLADPLVTGSLRVGVKPRVVKSWVCIYIYNNIYIYTYIYIICYIDVLRVSENFDV